MQALGEIVRLQVQRANLKLPNAPGAAHPRRYDPSPILSVDRLLLTPDGAVGLLDGDARVLDVHHTQHPASKNHDGVNDVSIGFTSHYAAMRERFGEHLPDGVAGENLLVRTSARVELGRLGRGLLVQTRDGGCALLEQVVVAEPCVPFTRFCLRLGPAAAGGMAVTDGLRALRLGLRGFYANYANAVVAASVPGAADGTAGTGGAMVEPGSAGPRTAEEVLLRLGDRVFVLDD